MLSSKITDIFFDLDHTLWDFDANSSLAFETIFKLRKEQTNKNYIYFYHKIKLQWIKKNHKNYTS